MENLNVSGRVLTVFLLTAFSLNVWAANVSLGTDANRNDTGTTNVAVGDYTLYSNTSGERNVASGYAALYSNTSGNYNIASGHQALFNNTSGHSNVASGYQALFSNTTGYGNVASGYLALSSSTTGDRNVASGYGALYSNTSGDRNVAVGRTAGFSALGSGNVFIGNDAGYYETGSDTLYIDNSATTAPLIHGNFSSNEVTINGSVEVTGNLTATALYHTNGTQMISYSGGTVHLGDSSMVFTDSTVSGTNADIMSSTVGRIQLGLNSTDTTTVVGALNVPNPTGFFNAAHKGYVDTLRRDMRNYDDRSVALSSALTALPTQGGVSSSACGIGSGVRGGYAAMALGCAAELSNFDLPEALPQFIRNASVNAGTSFLAHDDPDYTFKMGMTFNFGAPKSDRQASIRDTSLRHRLRQVEHQNHNLVKKTAATVNAVNAIERSNHNLVEKTAATVNALERSNRRLQAQIKNLQSDRGELLALRADNEILKIQIAQINELLMGADHVAIR